MMSLEVLAFLEADEYLKDRIEKEWGEKAAKHTHLSDGFSIVVVDHETLAGLISVCRKKRPAPLFEALDWYIDILEVHQDYRRRGIATQLINLVCERAKAEGVYQIRAWSSADKIQAIPMWKALGFGLCPAVTYPEGREVNGYFVVKVL